MQFCRPADARRGQPHELGDHGVSTPSTFIGATPVEVRRGADLTAPQGFLAEFLPSRAGAGIPPHFHPMPQFQVIMRGDGVLGRRAVTPGSFHYADAGSTYGPITPNDPAAGITYFTLRPEGTGETYWMPESRGRLKRKPGRNLLGRHEAGTVGVTTLVEPHPDGLAASSIGLRFGEPVEIPAAPRSGGRFLVVMHGTVLLDDRPAGSGTLVHLAGDDAVLLLTADAAAEVLLVQFPAPPHAY